MGSGSVIPFAPSVTLEMWDAFENIAGFCPQLLCSRHTAYTCFRTAVITANCSPWCSLARSD